MIAAATDQDLDFCFDQRAEENTGLKRCDLKCSDFIVCRQGDHCLLAHLIEIGLGVEVHIICPRSSSIKSRELALEIICYLKFLGYVSAFTSITKRFKRAHNMALKLGFVEVFTSETERFYWRQLCL